MEPRNELFAALSKAQVEFKKAVKDAANPFFKSNYADLESVIDAVRPALAKNGLCVIQSTDMLLPSERLVLKTILGHSSGQFVEGLYPINPVKNDPQGVSSAITYAKRVSLAAMVGAVATDEDDDAEASMGRNHQQPKQIIRAAVPSNTKEVDGNGIEVKREVVNHATVAKQSMQIGAVTEAQQKRLFAMAKKLNWTEEDRKKRLGLFGRTSSKDLTPQEYHQLTAEMEIEIAHMSNQP